MEIILRDESPEPADEELIIDLQSDAYFMGSFLLITMACLGLLQSIWIHRKLVY